MSIFADMDDLPSAHPQNGQQILTTGGFATEAHAVADIKRRLERIDLFNVYTEVWGTNMHTLRGKEKRSDDKTQEKGLRIDMILSPKKELIRLGWNLGAVGVEIKRSGEKLGRVVSQSMDYTRTAFEIEKKGGILTVLRWVFIWHLGKPYGDIQSVMAQNNIGWAYSDQYSPFVLGCDGTKALEWQSPDRFWIKQPICGTKVGSR